MWQAVVEPGKKPMAQAREAAGQNRADLVCVRGKAQFGLASRAVGHQAGMKPLAAVLADGADESFVGAFETQDGGFYVVAVRDEQILAGCDRLFDNKNDAVDFFHELFYGPNWGQSFAPKDWAIPSASETPIDEVIRDVKCGVKLAEASQRGQFIKLAVVIAILALGAGGYQIYSAYQEHLEGLESLRLMAERQKAADEARKRPPPVALPLPWEGKAFGVPAMLACAAQMMSAPLNVPGWAAQTVVCKPDQTPEGVAATQATVTVAYHRDGGTINWVAPAVTHGSFKPSVSFADGGVQVSWHFPLQPGTYTKDSPTRAAADVKRYLVSRFEEVYHTIDVKVEVPPPGATTGPGGHQKEIPASYQDLAVSFTTPHDLGSFVGILAPIPAFVTSSVKLYLAKWNWTIEGKVYDKLQPPPNPVH